MGKLPIRDENSGRAETRPAPRRAAKDRGALRDQLSRPLTDLRISVTDRCNFRCRYCMPREVFGSDFVFLPRSEILSFEEIHRVARVFQQFGVRKFRLTGGEPLLRADLTVLIEMLAALPDSEVVLTTNGALLAQQAEALATAGLSRVTVSLDAIDDDVFHRFNDVRFPVDDVLKGIAAAVEAGLAPVKVNAVIKKGVNEAHLVELVEHFRGSGILLRLIEYMDVGNTNGWKMDDVVSGGEILERIQAIHALEPIEPDHAGEVAKRWSYRDGEGEVGIITSVTQPFCGDCSRARVSADGRLYTCLFASEGIDIRELLRRDSGDDALRELVSSVWTQRRDRYSELRTRATAKQPRVEMSYIGG